MDKPLNVNMAGAKEIADAKIPAIGKEQAREIVKYRDENGPFGAWDDLGSVPGITDEMIDNLKEAATLGEDDTEDDEDAGDGDGAGGEDDSSGDSEDLE
jgi:competence ComEA-like helix-hairpin-helix protein